MSCTKNQTNRFRVVVYGTGAGLEKTLHLLEAEACQVIAVTDREKPKKTRVLPVPFLPVDELAGTYDYIAIGSLSYDKEITASLAKLGVPEDRILLPLRMNSPDSITLRKKLLQPKIVTSWIGFYGEQRIMRLLSTQGTSDCLGLTAEEAMRLNLFPDYSLQTKDYQRLANVSLVRRQIAEQSVKGAVAEFGVYRGDFSAFLSEQFPDRDLHLFDTFQGFPSESLEREPSDFLRQNKQQHFSDTSLELVEKRLETHAKEIFFHVGVFPESASDFDEALCFVSLDVDLYQPTLDGLRFFYERLSPRGYILVHDYNFSYYSGVKMAVDEFSKEKSVSIVPIADFYGSAIITKPPLFG